MNNLSVIDYVDEDGQTVQTGLVELLDTQRGRESLERIARRFRVPTSIRGYERDTQDVLDDLDRMDVEDDNLAKRLTGSKSASVNPDMDFIDLKADRARREAYDRAVSSLELVIERILDGKDESGIPVQDDESEGLIGEWVYTGNVGYNDEGVHLCYRWHADLPDGVEFDDQCFEVNSPHADWGDVDDRAIELTDEQRARLDEWISLQVAREERLSRRMNDLERSAIQALTEETGATDVKAYPEPGDCALVSDDCGVRVNIHYSYPQWVMARVGRGFSTRKRLDAESVRAALRRARKIDEVLAEAAALIRKDGRFTLVDGSPSNSIWLSRSNDSGGARFRVQITSRGSGLAVSGNAPRDEPLVREVEDIIRHRRRPEEAADHPHPRMGLATPIKTPETSTDDERAGA